ncbi:MAG TPA: hypothetical protein VFX70_20905 [Mycobacteriales bacterium]|nr:hypothetical protein [Mycobacteriales bacterium]
MRVRVGPIPPDPRRAARPAAHTAALTGLTALVLLVGSGVLAACTSTIAGTGAINSAAIPRPTGTPSPSADPSAGGTPSSAGTPGPASFHKLRFDLPAGWRITPGAGSACLDPDGASPKACTLQIVDLDTAPAGSAPVNPPTPHAQQGWWMGGGAPACDPNRTVPATASTLVTTSFVDMRNKTAAYSTWRVTCADPARNFSPRLWWLPVTRVALVQHSGGAGAVDTQVDRIIASVTVVG